MTALSATVVSSATGIVDAGAGIIYKPVLEHRRQSKAKQAFLKSVSSDDVSQLSPESSRSIGDGNSLEVLESTTRDSGSMTSRSRACSFSPVPTSPGPSNWHTAGTVAAASGKSLGAVWGVSVKSLVADLPQAAADGLFAVPRLYGEEPRNYGHVKGVKSGSIVAGKAFAGGLFDGITGLFVEPVKGGMKDGAWGVVKGVGKGTAGLGVKSAGGLCGLVGYAGQGASKSIMNASHRSARREIADARRVEGLWLLEGEFGRGLDRRALSASFKRLWDGLGTFSGLV